MLPEVPTSYEQGLGEFDCAPFYAVFAPAGTPQPILDKLRAAMTAALNAKETKELIEKTGSVIYVEPREQFDTEIRKQTEQYTDDFKRLGIQPE